MCKYFIVCTYGHYIVGDGSPVPTCRLYRSIRQKASANRIAKILYFHKKTEASPPLFFVLPEDNPRIRPEQIAVLIVLVRFSVTVFVGIFDFVIIDYTVICIACCDFYKSSAFVVMIAFIAFKTAVIINTAL